ncbi:hypothetical protein [Kangiella sp. HZ709]|uniref:hypothetical protein n=1 Tax=Kangiella sp. HZ709 TaxID=2666328 RepID=UPI001D0DA631|nr:hypothetical protein [Kangiella sp. HZ709]
MTYLKNVFKVFILSLILFIPPLYAVEEVPDASLNDIAIVRAHPHHGAVIIYNPNVCRQIGLACGFFRAHEYAHIYLKHIYRHPAHYPAAREASADCWAATHGRPNEILAAYNLFRAGGSSPNWRVYGDPQTRAYRVRSCAINANKWIGR